VIGVLEKTFNVGYKKIVKRDLLWNAKKRVVFRDYKNPPQIKTLRRPQAVEDHQETANTYN
jgi:hypothetical protein